MRWLLIQQVGLQSSSVAITMSLTTNEWTNVCGSIISTHWGWVRHICISKLNIIGLDNGSSPGRCQAIIRSNAGKLLIRNKLQWNLNRNSYTFIQENALENVVWKMAATLFRPQWVKWLLLWHWVEWADVVNTITMKTESLFACFVDFEKAFGRVNKSYSLN